MNMWNCTSASSKILSKVRPNFIERINKCSDKNDQ